MRSGIGWLMFASAAALSTACSGQFATPDARDTPHVQAAIEEAPPTWADAAKATYWGGQARQITLDNGSYVGPKGQHVELRRQHYVTGDLEGDGVVDAVVHLSVSDAGDETGEYIAVLRHLGMDTISLGTISLGRSVEVEDIRIAGQRIVVDVSRQGPSGPETARQTFELGLGELVKVGDEVITTR